MNSSVKVRDYQLLGSTGLWGGSQGSYHTLVVISGILAGMDLRTINFLLAQRISFPKLVER